MIVATFYKFTPLENLPELKSQIVAVGRDLDVRGSILLAPEGLNGYLSASPAEAERMVRFVEALPGVGTLEVKQTACERHAFGRFKVRLKREIVSMGRPLARDEPTGQYVDAQQWNELLQDPEVLVVDVRNHYEIEEGTFPGAADPGTSGFREFPGWVDQNLDPARHRRIAMFCTGGIRCEKATAYLLSRGFHDVAHLRGGIIRYLQTVEPEENRWEGSCYVFDERGAI